ncbi:MAG: hypothetical protein QM757_05235 [Paludibaculum sp.]
MAAENPHTLIRLLQERGGEATTTYPVHTIGQVDGAIRIAVPQAGRHLLVLTEAGQIWVWGDNSYGQLGTGDQEPVQGWMPLEGLTGIRAIAAGANHSLALKGDGTVWAWGANFEGQLGDGTLLAKSHPEQVPGLSGIISIAAGARFSAALRNDGMLFVFGANWDGLAPAERDGILMRPTALPGRLPIGELIVTDQSIHSRKEPAGRNLLPWRGEAGLVRVIEWTGRGIVLSEGGSVQQRVAATETILDVQTGWAVAWLEGTPPQSEPRKSTRSGAGEALFGGTLATPDLSISVLRGVPFTVGSPAGYAITVTNAGGSATSGTTTVTDVLPAGLTYGSSSGTGWACAAASQTVTCTNPTAIAPGATSALVLQVIVGPAAYPSVSNTVTVASAGDSVPENNTANVVHAVEAKPAGTTGMYAAGYFHALRLAPEGSAYAGTVWSAGLNNNGQLGDGTNVSRTVMQSIAGLSTATAVAAGAYHSLALKSDGTVWAWGYNNLGQVGDGTTTSRTQPTLVTGVTGVIAIASRGSHSVALKSDGTVWAWGNNQYGQLGDGTTVNKSVPVKVTGLAGIVQIACGRNHTLAIRADGTAWAWGHNGSGRLGDGTSTNRTTPVQVSGLAGITAITAGDAHSLALKLDGTIFAWGDNLFGELGDGSNTTRLTPVQVKNLTGVAAIAASYDDSVALLGNGTVWVWGLSAQSNVAAQVTGVSGASAIAIGGWWNEAFYFAMKADGTALAWGDNRYGQLSNGQITARRIPTLIAGIQGVKELSARESNTLAVKNDGTVWGWGDNSAGQLGDGTTISLKPSPVQIPGISNATSVGSGTGHSLALRSDGIVLSWGLNQEGELGDGTTNARTVPAAIAGLTGIVRFSAGYVHNLAIKNDGTVWAWGSNTHGELGDGTTTQRPTPFQVPGLTGIVQVATGDYFSLALKSDGTVWAWGDNSVYQLGNGTTTGRLSPAQVQGISGATAISAGYRQAVVLRNDGTVWIWGTMDGGPMGDGSKTTRTLPVQVSGLTGITAISAGGQHCLALKTGGTVWAWGSNSTGQLGDGTTQERLLPVRVGILSGVIAIEAGGSHSAVILADGSVWGWGTVEYGQVGDGSQSVATSPRVTLPFTSPDLTIAMTDGGSVPVGGRLVFTLTVTNSGNAPSSGTITVVDTLPTGLSYFSASGTDWSCSASGQTVTCTRSTALSAGSSSAISLQATVLAAAVPGVTNAATVANASDFNLDNNTAGDPVVVGTTSGVVLSPASGSGSQQTFQAVYSGSMGHQYLRWVQLLFATASDGGGQPYCFLHYDVTGNAFWLYSDVYGFFRGPVAPGAGLGGSTRITVCSEPGSILSVRIRIESHAQPCRDVQGRRGAKRVYAGIGLGRD